jgi:chromosomal replication initiator protein
MADAEEQVDEHADLWRQCAAELREQVPEATWQLCFSPIVPLSYEEGVFQLGVPDRLIREKIESSLVARIERALAAACQRDVRVDLHVVPQTVAQARAEAPPSPRRSPSSSEVPPLAEEIYELEFSTAPRPLPETAEEVRSNGRPTRRDSLEILLDGRFTFESFVTAASNRLAVAAAQSVAEMPAHSYNPLFIYGDSGLGKTHLLHAIGNYVHQQFPRHRVVYVTAETLRNDFVEAIQKNRTIQFKRRYREADVTLIDDIQFIEHSHSLREEFFHTYNDLYGSGKQIVMTSDRSPKDIATLDERLRSRFLSGLITKIDPPDLETRLAILRSKASAEGLYVPPDVLEFIASHVRDNIRELEGALIRVAAHASLNKEEHLDREMAERVLSDIVSAAEPRSVTPAMILQATATAYDFPIEALCGPLRTRPLVTARQVAMYVMRELTEYSYPAIGRVFGNRDHTTVIHAVTKVTAQMQERPQIYRKVNALIQEIKAGP